MSEHKEFRVYDECGHDHAEGEPGVVEVWEFGLTCEDGYMYSLCEACHTHAGECHEDSPMEQAWPCDAAKALARVEELKAELETWKDALRLERIRADVEATYGKEGP